MYKIGIIGDRDSVLGFMALGLSVFEADSAERAGELLHSLCKDPEYAIIFLTEKYAALLEEETAKYKDLPMPAIITIPGKEGSSGYGMASIKTAVEKAVGADILFK